MGCKEQASTPRLADCLKGLHQIPGRKSFLTVQLTSYTLQKLLRWKGHLRLVIPWRSHQVWQRIGLELRALSTAKADVKYKWRWKIKQSTYWCPWRSKAVPCCPPISQTIMVWSKLPENKSWCSSSQAKHRMLPAHINRARLIDKISCRLKLCGMKLTKKKDGVLSTWMSFESCN